ncbi:MAG TPA: ABC transporter substrate-binding protein [Terriglobales bacterium]|nr:ABC transporter substrate-binding protein [Terriglobales bacterium]
MKLTGLRLIAISSVLIAAAAAAATRPHYGGTLHVQMASTLTSLDPADASQRDTLAARNLFALIFDTLVTLNDRGQPQPALAISWQAEPGNQRWEFVLRPGVTFSDGTPMTPEAVAASLRRANPTWKVTARENSAILQMDIASPDLPAELALPRNSIVGPDTGKIPGTGPFVVSQWDPGRKVVMAARDDYWGARPFLDSVEMEIGKNFREQTVSYELGQSQVIEIPVDQVHHANEARQLRASEPMELVALLFARDVQSPEEAKQRQALALSIDRDLLNRVVLQGGGEPTGGLLPDWLSGYGFLFPGSADLARAQQLRAEVPQAPLWSLGYDGSDPLQRVLAERIVLNAGDAGLRLQLANTSTPDIRLVRIRVASLDAHVALTELAKSLGLPPPRFLGNSIDDLYHAESAMVQSERVIPLVHLRTGWAVSKTVRDWEASRDGAWRLPEVWLVAGKP